ncbi:hypothetical protein EW146_g10478, partial [Bondarzewia mesenterica]
LADQVREAVIAPAVEFECTLDAPYEVPMPATEAAPSTTVTETKQAQEAVARVALASKESSRSTPARLNALVCFVPLFVERLSSTSLTLGLEPEFISHNTMRGLSGIQKVKIVLGAATWHRAHIICLDEPMNYLDRESLAALIEVLKVFEGSVLIIIHNRNFSESICKEMWAMRDSHLEASGHNWVEGQGSGPRIDKKERMAWRKKGEDVSDDEL